MSFLPESWYDLEEFDPCSQENLSSNADFLIY